MSILVVGTVAFDSIETPSGSVDRELGGSASYFAVAASFFAPVQVVGVVGEDFPRDYIELLSSAGSTSRDCNENPGRLFIGAAATMKTSMFATRSICV